METEDIKSDEGERANMLYQLSFNYWDDDPSNDDHIILAVYSSEEQLNKGLEKFKKQPRFAGKEDSFWISERKVNEERSEGTHPAYQSSSDNRRSGVNS